MPVVPVTAVGVPITAGPDRVTVTPGNTPPWSSVTFPTNSPNVWPVCAAAGARPNIVTIASAASTRMNVPSTGDLLLAKLQIVCEVQGYAALYRFYRQKLGP